MHLNKHSWNERTKGQKIRINEPERNGMYFGKEWLCENRWQGQQVELKKKKHKGWREDRGGIGHGWGENMSHKLTSGCGLMGLLNYGCYTAVTDTHTQNTDAYLMAPYSNWLTPTSSKTRQNLENLMWRQCRVRLILSARDERGTKVSGCHETHLTLSKDLGRVYFFSFFEVDRWKWELQLPVACSYQASFASGLLIKIGF